MTRNNAAATYQPGTIAAFIAPHADRIVAMRAAGATWKDIAVALRFEGELCSLRYAWLQHFGHLSPRRRLIQDLRAECMERRAAGMTWNDIAQPPA